MKERVRFIKNCDESFYTDLRKEVYTYFHSHNHSIHANRYMVLKTVFFFCLFISSYILILFTDVSTFSKLVACFVHGISITGIGFNVAHDCSHNAYFRKKQYNLLLSYSMDLIGSNSYTWDLKHNKSHHIYTNIESFDDDIKGSCLLRLSPHAPFHRINKYQNMYAWLLYCLTSLYVKWVYNFVQFTTNRLGSYQDIKHPQKEWMKMIGWKLFYVLYAVSFPLWWLNLSATSFLVGYCLVEVTSGFLLGITFYLAHCVENTFEFPDPQNAEIHKSWAMHQMETTSNFAMKNKFITWFCGGLNFQIEHHLFPEICSIHYPDISRIVQRVSLRHQVHYKYYDDVWTAVKAHYRALKKLGNPYIK